MWFQLYYLDINLQAYNQRYRENIKLLTTPIKTILELLAKSELKIIFLADKNHRLVGSVTDGDIRRWLLATPEKNLSTPVKQAMNPNPARATEHTTSSGTQLAWEEKGFQA